jgi:hypothetical protein
MYVVDSHGWADAPPLLYCTNARLLGICEFRCTRVTQPRGADAPALGCTCVCASRKSPFHPHTFAPANRSGGREPAVDLGSASVMATPRTRSAADYRATKERRASARRGWRKRICKGDTANVRETAAGVPANVVAIAVAGEALVVFRVTGRWHCECASANHGGLTPPALGCTCVCASQKSPCHRHTFAPANRSGEREPAVGGRNASARAIPQPAGDCRRCAGERYRNYGREPRGVMPPALGCRSHVAERCSIHPARCSCHPSTGGGRPPLLAVHTFVHRKSRHFTGRDSCIQAGAAGVSPPWIWEVHL